MTRASRWRHSPGASRIRKRPPAACRSGDRGHQRPIVLVDELGQAGADQFVLGAGRSSCAANGWRSGSRSRRAAPAGRSRTAPGCGSVRSAGARSRPARRPAAVRRRGRRSRARAGCDQRVDACIGVRGDRPRDVQGRSPRSGPPRSAAAGAGRVVAIRSPAVTGTEAAGRPREQRFAAGGHVVDQPRLLFDLGPQGASGG